MFGIFDGGSVGGVFQLCLTRGTLLSALMEFWEGVEF